MCEKRRRSIRTGGERKAARVSRLDSSHMWYGTIQTGARVTIIWKRRIGHMCEATHANFLGILQVHTIDVSNCMTDVSRPYR
jgi:pyridoxal biosynthesis lyase PdxS